MCELPRWASLALSTNLLAPLQADKTGQNRCEQPESAGQRHRRYPKIAGSDRPGYADGDLVNRILGAVVEAETPGHLRVVLVDGIECAGIFRAGPAAGGVAERAGGDAAAGAVSRAAQFVIKQLA